MEAGGVVGADRVLVEVVGEEIGVEGLELLLEVVGAAHLETVAVDDQSGEALAVLDVHVLKGSALRQLRPGGDVLEVFQDLGAGGLGVVLGHAADRRWQATEFGIRHLRPTRCICR